MYILSCILISAKNYQIAFIISISCFNSSQNPSERIMGVLDYLKASKKDQAPFSFKIPFTRQQLASLTGLCVETAIRVIKDMERKKVVMIKDRKIYF
ncbi:helix-turn-helix domain-containing protein [Chryseobacterium sp. W4I1]|uniref:helix-turn-helix domain-containing protein n=1 Tax=Chryseobacterium sp. W4I1 TaxID=3042293 RepID=UPI002785013B|nr:helix-turn-helix domain-containing protein [Chryseobacterium sp. W4I1]MDQ0780548.1 CRP-like cAMP-binding protein [Chryseobacterium sp. W4I1]